MHSRPITCRGAALISGVVVMKARSGTFRRLLNCGVSWETGRQVVSRPKLEGRSKIFSERAYPHVRRIRLAFFRVSSNVLRHRSNVKDAMTQDRRGTKRSSEEHVSTARCGRGSMVDQSRSKEEHRYSLEKIISRGCL